MAWDKFVCYDEKRRDQRRALDNCGVPWYKEFGSMRMGSNRTGGCCLRQQVTKGGGQVSVAWRLK